MPALRVGVGGGVGGDDGGNKVTRKTGLPLQYSQHSYSFCFQILTELHPVAMDVLLKPFILIGCIKLCLFATLQVLVTMVLM